MRIFTIWGDPAKSRNRLFWAPFWSILGLILGPFWDPPFGSYKLRSHYELRKEGPEIGPFLGPFGLIPGPVLGTFLGLFLTHFWASSVPRLGGRQAAKTNEFKAFLAISSSPRGLVLGTFWVQFLVHFAASFGSILGPFRGQFLVNLGICFGARTVSDLSQIRLRSEPVPAQI